MFEVIPVVDGKIGGHYAVRGLSGEVLGKEFDLGMRHANVLSNMLNAAFNEGRKAGEGKSNIR